MARRANEQSVETRPRRGFVIAIDGPAGAGKSTVARAVAARLGYQYIDSGAMYRVVALLALERGTDLNDAPALAQLAAEAEMHFESGNSETRVLLQGRDVTGAIRSPEVTRASSIVSVHAEVRRKLVERQQAMGREGGVVMEGRDIGTCVFPNADLKIFLEASPAIRAQRRLRDMADLQSVTEAEVASQIEERDLRDRTRQASPLAPADDAVRIDTTARSADQVVEEILGLVEEKRSSLRE